MMWLKMTTMAVIIAMLAACGGNGGSQRASSDAATSQQGSSSDDCAVAMRSTQQPVYRAADAIKERILVVATAAAFNDDNSELNRMKRYTDDLVAVWPSLGQSGISRYHAVNDLLDLADGLAEWDRDSALDDAVDDLKFAERELSVCL